MNLLMKYTIKVAEYFCIHHSKHSQKVSDKLNLGKSVLPNTNNI